MKVNPLTAPLNFINQVRRKADRDPSSGQGQQGYQGENRDDRGDEREFDEHLVEQAVEAFQSDSSARDTGITADQVGSGPGLRVVLKDKKGDVIRNLSGEEFLKLREAAEAESPRGKILDQKC